MALKTDIQGMVWKYPDTFVVGREQVRQYAKAVKSLVTFPRIRNPRRLNDDPSTSHLLRKIIPTTPNTAVIPAKGTCSPTTAALGTENRIQGAKPK